MVSYFLKSKQKEKVSIYCSINFKGEQRITIALTNLKISPKDWAKGKMSTGRGKQENSRIQHQLDKMKERIECYYFEYHRLFKKYPNRSELIKYISSNSQVDEYLHINSKLKISDFVKRIIERRQQGKEFVRGKKFSTQSYSMYHSLLLSLDLFQKFCKKPNLWIEDFLTKDIIEKYEGFLMNELEMMKNTIHNRMKTLKSFLEIAVSENVIPFNPFRKFNIILSTEETDAVVFSKSELKELEELDLSDDPHLDRIRDQYLLYVWSGIRKSDLKNFLAVVNPVSQTFSFRSQKTGERCDVPAFSSIKRIAEKYNYSFPEPVRDTIVLKEIKYICSKISSMHITIEKKYTRKGKTVRDLKKKYELIVIHTARRTLATLLVDHGLPFQQVMKITGHKKLTTLQKYIKSDTDTQLILQVENKINSMS